MSQNTSSFAMDEELAALENKIAQLARFCFSLYKENQALRTHLGQHDQIVAEKEAQLLEKEAMIEKLQSKVEISKTRVKALLDQLPEGHF